MNAEHNLADVMVCWDVGGQAAILSWPDHNRRSDVYEMTSGACYTAVGKLSPLRKQLFVMALYVHMTERDHVPVKNAFAALEHINKFCEALASYEQVQWGVME